VREHLAQPGGGQRDRDRRLPTHSITVGRCAARRITRTADTQHAESAARATRIDRAADVVTQRQLLPSPHHIVQKGETMNRPALLLAGIAATAAAVAPGTAAGAQVPPARSFLDLADQFADTSCIDPSGAVVGTDLIVNPGGGNVAWLPDGTKLVGSSFAMYDATGGLLLVKSYGSSRRTRDGAITCTSHGIDPDSGQQVTVVFTAVAG
jgi:hypothetical protein